ncbi:MAG: DUF3142 domain-containing protein, partial [Candidatus Hydrogenedentes bacterium]|nr:DUF3142 domain-containing protein [Candidatus Hydrogenedentota bacterium]
MNDRFLRTPSAVLCLFVLVLTGCSKPQDHPPAPARSRDPLAQEAYVWQRAWTPEVSAAVHAAAKAFSGYSIIAAECRLDEAPVIPEVDWAALAAQRPVTLVLRANVSFVPALEEAPEEVAQAWAAVLAASLAVAEKAGVTVAGVQLDYDCPTARIAAYAKAAAAFAAAFPHIETSLTALPDWLRSADFPALVKPLDYFVLQVHGLEPPTTADAPVVLCRADRVEAWSSQAAQAGVPFFLALPTYGYDIAYDEHGNFAGLAAELPMDRRPYPTLRTVMPDPDAMARIVRGLSAEHPAALRGVIWFRLPVEGDRLNWTMPALQQVMQGIAPQFELHAEVRTPQEGLYEIWLASTGDYQPAAGEKHVKIALK